MDVSPVLERPGLRARKAARTRLAIAAALEERLLDRDLHDISVDELAEAANVSRMTFFNYFPSKRDAVDFLLVTMVYRIEATIHREQLRGVAAIERTFEMMGDHVAEGPNRIRRIYALHMARPPGPLPELTLADRLQLTPDLDFELMSLGFLFVRCVEEAQQDGVAIVGSPYEVSHFLGGLMNGAALIGQRPEDDTDYKQLFRRHARRALGLLGAEGMRDPKPPRIPKRYRKKGRTR